MNALELAKMYLAGERRPFGRADLKTFDEAVNKFFGI